jgi:preprotein translocase subunit SecF
MATPKKQFDIVGNRRFWYIFSTILILPGVISLIIWHLRVGIDFKGGTLQQVHFASSRPDVDALRNDLKAVNPDLSIQTSGDQDVLIRFPNQDNVQPRTTGDTILSTLKADGLSASEASFETIGGSVAKSTTTTAIEAVILTSVAIILFIAWSFASVPKPASSWRFGVTAILALAHDILFVIGAFSLIGHFFPSIEVDSLFITAILTILGFSVNDTIVVFDRIRENLRRTPGRTFSEIANASLNQTLARSLNTSMTVLIVLLALLLLGGPSIRTFILALFLGVAIGTYSSIFNATPLLVSWQGMADKRAALEPAKKRK